MDQNTMVGMVVVSLSTIVGLFLTIGKPILDLKEIIVKLQVTVDMLLKKQENNDVEHFNMYKRIQALEKDSTMFSHQIKELENKKKEG